VSGKLSSDQNAERVNESDVEAMETMVVEEKKSDEATSVENNMDTSTGDNVKTSIMTGEFNNDDEEEGDEDTGIDHKGKIEAILFSIDEGPSSELFQDDDNNEAPDTPITDPFVDEILRSKQLSSSPDADDSPPPGTRPPVRSVKFEGLDSLSSQHSSLEDNSPEGLMDRLEKTQQRLTQAQIDLSGEKALRKRKEKNLVKLAKELKKRASESELQQVQIHKVCSNDQ